MKVTNIENILKALGNDESHSLAFPLQEGVRRHGRPHPDPLDLRRLNLSTGECTAGLGLQYPSDSFGLRKIIFLLSS